MAQFWDTGGKEEIFRRERTDQVFQTERMDQEAKNKWHWTSETFLEAG